MSTAFFLSEKDNDDSIQSSLVIARGSALITVPCSMVVSLIVSSIVWNPAILSKEICSQDNLSKHSCSSTRAHQVCNGGKFTVGKWRLGKSHCWYVQFIMCYVVYCLNVLMYLESLRLVGRELVDTCCDSWFHLRRAELLYTVCLSKSSSIYVQRVESDENTVCGTVLLFGHW